LNVDEIDIRGQFHPAFMPADPKSTVSFVLLGSAGLKTAQKLLLNQPQSFSFIVAAC